MKRNSEINEKTMQINENQFENQGNATQINENHFESQRNAMKINATL